MTSEWVVYFVAFAALYLVLLSIRLRREGIRYQLRRSVILGAMYIGVVWYLRHAGWNPIEAVIGGVIAGLIGGMFIRKRSRYIPRAERRKIIARFERETGEKFDPRIHEIGHDIPFSSWGSNTPDNLRVETRRSNRSKGARSPWWDLLGR